MEITHPRMVLRQSFFLGRDDRRIPGKLMFRNGSCIRAEVDSGSSWEVGGELPLMDITFTLYFRESETPHIILIKNRQIKTHCPRGSVQN